MKSRILLLATFDTKAEEALYLKQRIEAHGCAALLMDTGILTNYAGPLDVKPQEVARAAGEDLESLRAGKDKGRCIAAMCAGARRVALSLYEQSRF